MSRQSNREMSIFSNANSVMKVRMAYTLFHYIHILIVKVSEEVWSCLTDILVTAQSIQVATATAEEDSTSPSSSYYSSCFSYSVAGGTTPIAKRKAEAARSGPTSIR